MGQVLHRGRLQGREPVGGGSTMGTETGVDNEFAKVRRFSEGPGLRDPRRGYGNLP